MSREIRKFSFAFARSRRGNHDRKTFLEMGETFESLSDNNKSLTNGKAVNSNYEDFETN